MRVANMPPEHGGLRANVAGATCHASSSLICENQFVDASTTIHYRPNACQETHPALTGPEPSGLLNGSDLLAVFAAASRHLRELASSIDAINVYPVPDGDTGTNMSATLREAIDRATLLADSPPVAEVLGAIAKGGLFGARGNSGVILSQALRGFADAVGEVGQLDARGFGRGLAGASSAAYAAVSRPHEGTMLTVLRTASEAAAAHTSRLVDAGEGQSCIPTLLHAIAAAEQAEEATMEQLPALKEAGVPDAGGEGICVILRGLEAAISGRAPRVHTIPHQPIAMLEGHIHESLGYCTEFLIEPLSGQLLDLESLRAWLSTGTNSSVVVIGDADAGRIHVHTSDPDALIAEAERRGHISRLKVENMDTQHRRFRETGSGAGRSVAVLALSHGEGFNQVFASLGAEVADLGEVVKPPAGDIAAAADALSVPDVIVLPNHKNVVLSARQAATLARCTLHVVPTESLPQGVAALVAFNPEVGAAINVAEMSASAPTVRTIEVTIAAADRKVEGIAITTGQAIALVDGRLVAAAASAVEALTEGLRTAGVAPGALVTIYSGDDVSATAFDEARLEIRRLFPEVELEAVAGGQPLYAFIASVEN